MSVHIQAKSTDISDKVIIPGDPLRAKYIAETFLEKVTLYNEVRGMLGFTGYYKGKRVSVQGTGMGLPSLSIYVNELMSEFKAKSFIRVGTCGAFQKEIELRSIILAQTASTDSNINRRIFNNLDYAPTADFNLLLKAHNHLESNGVKHYVGNILSTDTFYNSDTTESEKWVEYNILAAEMESSALYTLAAKNRCQALSILTVSDSIPNGTQTTAKERENSFSEMVEVALEII
ncbi:MAG: purine-nucleoside phosphorylase [Halobacteriovoraceae bacterium]|nr:purine-nucleoside phosphorylase [Halobacteriovoraceae bacterium]MCB9093932.1 purine-nucleoside phosphorylase [Halobacteriovoraceae bacterium]